MSIFNMSVNGVANNRYITGLLSANADATLVRFMREVKVAHEANELIDMSVNNLPAGAMQFIPLRGENSDVSRIEVVANNVIFANDHFVSSAIPVNVVLRYFRQTDA